jgi:hypothetical protein
MTDASSTAPGDALDALTDANEEVAMLMKKWADDTDRLDEGDDVNVRWERGSAVKLALEHLAVREAAKRAVSARVAELDPELAGRLEGDSETRRELIAALDEVVRGHEAINLNGSPVDEAMARVREMVLPELGTEHDETLPAVRQLLGPPEERDLPSQRRVQMTSETHPSPHPRWYDRVWVIKAVKALYDSLRTAPRGGTAPSVDAAREHTPGPRQ